MVNALAKNDAWQGRKGPVVLVIMDGVGYGQYTEGDAVADAHMEALEKFHETCPVTRLKAHGTAVGLPPTKTWQQRGSHNAIGCGRVFAQGAKLVSTSIETGAMFEGQTWKTCFQ